MERFYKHMNLQNQMDVKVAFFEEYHPLCSDYVCAAKEREDGKDVIFKETINKTTIAK